MYLEFVLFQILPRCNEFQQCGKRTGVNVHMDRRCSKCSLKYLSQPHIIQCRWNLMCRYTFWFQEWSRDKKQQQNFANLHILDKVWTRKRYPLYSSVLTTIEFYSVSFVTAFCELQNDLVKKPSLWTCNEYSQIKQFSLWCYRWLK